VIGNAALMQADRVHPKAAGVDRIADKVAPLLAKQLQGERQVRR
jgi:acyl-CoA thioesterase-1